MAADNPVNYFVEGASWISVQTTTSYPKHTGWFYRSWLGETAEVGGYEALPLWVEDLSDDKGPCLSTYVRHDAGKVYFLSEDEPQEWKLMYDFTLQPGEETEICDFLGNVSWFSGNVRCMKVYPLETNPELQVIELAFCDELEEIAANGKNDEWDYSAIRWIVGMGNMGGPEENLYFNGIAGGGCLLGEFTVGDNVIYRHPEFTGVPEVKEPVNYFVEGASWISHSTSSSYPVSPKWFSKAWTGEAVEIAGYEALPLLTGGVSASADDDSCLSTYVRHENGKVYFLSDDEPQEWKLMYDFTLQPGDEADIEEYNQSALGYGGRVRCMDVYPLPSDPDLQVMELAFCEELKDIEEAGEEGERVYSIIRWIAGVGNTGGPLQNLYNEGIIGYGYQLDELTVGENLIYRHPEYTAVYKVADIEKMEIRVSKGEIAVIGSEDAAVSVYRADGVRCNAGQGRFSSLAPGIYIVKVNGESRRIMVP